MAIDYVGNQRTPGGYPTTTPKYPGTGLNKPTRAGFTPQRVKKNGSYKGHPLPLQNDAESDYVGVGEDASYYNPKYSPYVQEYSDARGNAAATDTEGRPMPVATNTWTELARLKDGSEADITALQKDLVKAGWLTKQSITGTWTESTDKAMRALMLVGNKNFAGWRSIVQQDKQEVKRGGPGGGIDNGGGPGGSDGPPQDYTSVSTSYNKMPKRDALTAVKDAMTEDLGRAPTEQELQGFIRDLRQFERANPNVTTTEHKYEQQGDMWVDNPVSTTEPGADPAGLLDTYAEDKNPKAVKRYKKANVLASVIDDIANGVL